MNKIFTELENENKYTDITVIGVGRSGCHTVDELYLNSDSNVKIVCIGLKDNDTSQLLFVQPKKQEIFIVTTFLNDEEGITAAIRLSKKMEGLDIFSICIIPYSYAFESQHKSIEAKKKLQELVKNYTAVIVPETKVLSEPLKSQKMSKTLSDLAVYTINTVADTFFNKGANDISLDFSDLKTIMKGQVVIESVQKNGRGSAIEAMNTLIYLHNEVGKLSAATGIICIFKMNPDFSSSEFIKAMEMIEEYPEEDIDIIFSTITDNSYDISYIEITTFISYFNEKVPHTICSLFTSLFNDLEFRPYHFF